MDTSHGSGEVGSCVSTAERRNRLSARLARAAGGIGLCLSMMSLASAGDLGFTPPTYQARFNSFAEQIGSPIRLSVSAGSVSDLQNGGKRIAMQPSNNFGLSLFVDSSGRVSMVGVLMDSGGTPEGAENTLVAISAAPTAAFANAKKIDAVKALMELCIRADGSPTALTQRVKNAVFECSKRQGRTAFTITAL